MRIVCLGSNGASTPPIAANNDSGWFDKAWGVFQKIGTIATPDKAPIIIQAPQPAFPIAAIAGIGIVAFILLKAVK